MNESINQLINDEAVCRTAPATPGLSIRTQVDSKVGYSIWWQWIK